jgi:hypothetical protein
MQRKLMLSNQCDRCCNDFAAGANVINLPFIKKYINLCNVCMEGIKVHQINVSKNVDWTKFWEADYEDTKITKLY